jgi:hypothetical protein
LGILLAFAHSCTNVIITLVTISPANLPAATCAVATSATATANVNVNTTTTMTTPATAVATAVTSTTRAVSAAACTFARSIVPEIAEKASGLFVSAVATNFEVHTYAVPPSVI